MNFKVVLQRLCIKALATKQLAHNDFLFVTGEQVRNSNGRQGFGLETAPKKPFWTGLEGETAAQQVILKLNSGRRSFEGL